MDNAISNLLDMIVPDMATLLADMRFWLGLVLILGPVLLLAIGAYDYYLAPPEANHKAGYRTYYGMGSVKAWRYTQKLAGAVFMMVGAGLLVASIICCFVMIAQGIGAAVTTGLVMLIIQVAAVLAAYGFIEFSVARRFDENGKEKKK